MNTSSYSDSGGAVSGVRSLNAEELTGRGQEKRHPCRFHEGFFGGHNVPADLSVKGSAAGEPSVLQRQAPMELGVRGEKAATTKWWRQVIKRKMRTRMGKDVVPLGETAFLPLTLAGGAR